MKFIQKVTCVLSLLAATTHLSASLISGINSSSVSEVKKSLKNTPLGELEHALIVAGTTKNNIKSNKVAKNKKERLAAQDEIETLLKKRIAELQKK